MAGNSSKQLSNIPNSPDDPVSPTFQYCNLCERSFSKRNTWERLFSDEGIRIWREEDLIMLNAGRSCPLCQWLHGFIVLIWENSYLGYLRDTAEAFMAQITKVAKQAQPLRVLEEAFDATSCMDWIASKRIWEFRFWMKEPGKLHCRLMVEGGMWPRNTRILLCGRGDAKARIVGSQAAQLDLNDSGTYHQIRRWARECNTSHPVCAARARMFSNRPSRLLEVRDESNETIRLIDAGTRDLRYAALSYCWGAPQPNRLLQGRLAEYKQGIRIEALPLTIQDTIAVTRRLQLQYLWVDALCIIQDSDQDKSKEVASMGAIYGTAFITLNVAMAANCNEGFLNRQTPTACAGFNLKMTLPDGETAHLMLLTTDENTRISLLPEPIRERGWTYQERFMSRRMLTVQRQFFWHCSEPFLGADGGGLTRDDYRNYFSFTPDDRDAYHTPMGTALIGSVAFNEVSPDLDTNGHRKLWTSILGAFLRMKLSVASDRLPAFSAFATFFASRMKDRYLAGLWEFGIMTWLEWTPSPGGQERSRPLVWRAPSWSPLSCEWDRVTGGDHFRVPAFVGGDDLAKYRGARVQLANDETPYGEIRAAEVDLEGQLIPSVLLWLSDDIRPDGGSWYVISKDASAQAGVANKIRVIGGAILDVELPPAGQGSPRIHGVYGILSGREDIYCFPLARGDERWTALVLSALPGGKYQRIGIVDGNVYTWEDYQGRLGPQTLSDFEGLNRTIITIV